MKKVKVLLSLSVLAGAMLLSSFSPKKAEKPQSAGILNYAWYTPTGEFVAWSTLVNAEIVSDANTDPTDGTLVIEGYTGGGEGEPPVGSPVYELYTHP